jgi:hypothetical protein
LQRVSILQLLKNCLCQDTERIFHSKFAYFQKKNDHSNVDDEGGDCEDSGGDGIVEDDDDGDSSGLSVEQQIISSDSVICEDISIVEVTVEEEAEVLTFFS